MFPQVDIDRVLTSILEWIGAVIWARKSEPKEPTYTTIQEWRFTGKGILKYIKANPKLRPRDVCSFIFIPFRYGVKDKDLKDVHLMCDFLQDIGGVKQRIKPTHRITIAKASHFPKADGHYDFDILWVADYDLQGQQMRRDFHVKCVMQKVANLLRVEWANSIEWEQEIDNAISRCRDGRIAPGKRIQKRILARGLDGTSDKVITIDWDRKLSAKLALARLVMMVPMF